ncbi:MAG: hypothetical protein M3322_06290, partial [Actinomycetota bacterium]|nr:hypothetical protein [Actinomycetota bacterium]
AERARGQDNVERPRTDEDATSAAGREQPAIEPDTEGTAPAGVVDAPDTTTQKTTTEDPTKLEQSGDPGREGSRGSGGEGSGHGGRGRGRS